MKTKLKPYCWRPYLLVALIAAATPYLHAQSFAGEKLKGTLCHADETVMFSCDSGIKKIAVCASPTQASPLGFLRYRFGNDQSLDLEFPRQPKPLLSYASGNNLSIGGRGGVSYLRLMNGDISYTVFYAVVNPSYQRDDASEQSGVIVERKGKVLARRLCDADKRTYANMSDSTFLGRVVPLDKHGVTGIPSDHP